MSQTEQSPEIIVEMDYEGVFLNRVKSAIKLNLEAEVKMYPKILIEAGPYKPYCLQWSIIDENTIKLEFYAAARVFGFEHSVKDIADSIKLK